MPEAHPRPGLIAGLARILTTKGRSLKRYHSGLRAILVALGLFLAAAAAPASAATLTFLSAGQYGVTDETAWLLRPPGADLSTVSTVALSSDACSPGEVCGTITLANKSPEETGTKRTAADHYLTAVFTDGDFSAIVNLTVNEGNEFRTCAISTGAGICPDAISAAWSVSAPDGAALTGIHPAGYIPANISGAEVAQGAFGLIEIRKVEGAGEVLPPVPVPAALPLMAGALGLGALVGGKRRRK